MVWADGFWVEGFWADGFWSTEVGEPEPDETAPTLSSPAGVATSSGTATGTVSTDEANGTLFWAVTESETPAEPFVPTGSQAVTKTGTQTVFQGGLTAETTYYFHFLHADAADNESDIATSSSFATPEASTGSPALHSRSNTTLNRRRFGGLF